MNLAVPGLARRNTDVAEALVDAISSVRRAARRQAGRVEALSSLSGAEMELVRALRRRPGRSVAEVAAELGLAANTVSTLVGRLARAGVVQRQVGPGDKRVVRLALSPGVAQRVGEWAGRRVAALSGALGRLAEEDQEALAAAVGPLQRLARALDLGGGPE